MKDEVWAEPSATDPLNLVKCREHHRVQRSTLPQAKPKRIAELRVMYELQSAPEQKLLQAVRARRAIDAIDVFHAQMRHEWEGLSEYQRATMDKISVVTNRMQRKLRGLANSNP